MAKAIRGKNKDWLEGIRLEGFNELISTQKYYRYKEVCEILNIPVLPSGSNSQFKQLESINMLCEYEKNKGKFYFVKLRNEEDIDVFKARMTYTQLIKYALAQAFLKEDIKDKMINDTLFITMPRLMELCGMINKNFNEVRNSNEYKLWSVSLMHKDEFGRGADNNNNLRRFVSISYDVIKPLMRDALKSMDNEHSVVIQKAYVIYKKLDNGTIISRKVLCFDKDGIELFKIMGDVLTEFDIIDIRSLYFENRWRVEQFHQRCNELCKDRLGYDGFYDCYALKLYTDRIRYLLNTEYSKVLNVKIQDKLKESKRFEELGTKFKENLINATISLDTSYDFKEDYRIAQEMRAGK